MRKGALVAVAALLAVAGFAAWRYYDREAKAAHERARETALRQNLTAMRRAIKTFHDDKGRYPRSLEELVPDYIRRIPADPMTGSTSTWRLSTEDVVRPSADFTSDTAPRTEPYVIDVHSGAGAPYSSW